VHNIEQAGGSKDPDSLVLKNHDEIHGVQEISINYTSSGELFDHTTIVVKSYFSTMVADFLNDPDPKKWQSVNNALTGSNGRKQSR
jgi:hypothetical protein